MIDGMEGIDKDFRQFMNTLIVDLRDALPKVMDDAKENLKQHIETDVYSASVYQPKVYKRRSENDGLGTPLNYMESPNVKIISPAGGNVGGKLQITTKLYYNPTGNHSVKKWHGVDYNELVGRIENKDPAYHWGNEKVPKRPFWQNFITEMVDGNGLESSFVRHMKEVGETVTADGSIVEDTFDREY